VAGDEWRVARKRKSGDNAEAQRAQSSEEKRGVFAASGRKSPPLETKGGAPSSSIVQSRNDKKARMRAGWKPALPEFGAFAGPVEDGVADSLHGQLR